MENSAGMAWETRACTGIARDAKVQKNEGLSNGYDQTLTVIPGVFHHWFRTAIDSERRSTSVDLLPQIQNGLLMLYREPCHVLQ